MAENMEELIKKLFVYHWQQKGVALITAFAIWLLVSHSMTSSKMVTGVAVRVINIPPGKTVEGLLPGGLLQKHITLTLNGNKELLNHIQSNDLEVLLDASNKEDEWIAHISHKNLISLNPEIDILKGITSMTHMEFPIKLVRLVTAKIPIIITQPIGEPPDDYQFLDVWPQQLFHSITGSEEAVNELRSKGLYLIFDLRRISQEELNHLSNQGRHGAQDEVSFPVPDSWKQITLPFLDDEHVYINDPHAAELRITFLKQEFLPLERELPLNVFYPLKYSEQINPKLYALRPNKLVQETNGIMTLSQPLYSNHVSRLFLDVVRDYLEISLIVSSPEPHQQLEWSIQFIHAAALEKEYIRRLLPHYTLDSQRDDDAEPEAYLSQRFRDYMQRFMLYKNNQKPLAIDSHLEGQTIVINDV